MSILIPNEWYIPIEKWPLSKLKFAFAFRYAQCEQTLNLMHRFLLTGWMLLLSIAVALRYEHKALSGVILADRYIHVVNGEGGWSVSRSGLLGLHP